MNSALFPHHRSDSTTPLMEWVTPAFNLPPAKARAIERWENEGGKVLELLVRSHHEPHSSSWASAFDQLRAPNLSWGALALAPVR